MTEEQLIKKIKKAFKDDGMGKLIGINTVKAEVLWLDTDQNEYFVNNYEVTPDWQIEWAPMPHECFNKV